MQPTISELLTARFYAWEQLGRGWLVYDECVDIEPPFTPFYRHYLGDVLVPDDTKRETWLSSLGTLFKRKRKPPVQEEEEKPDLEAHPYGEDARFSAFAVMLARDSDIDIADMEKLLLMLSDTEYPVSFEIIGTTDDITIQFFCRTPDAAHVCNQISAYFPTVRLVDKSAQIADDLEGDTAIVVDFGLKEEFMWPLRTLGRSDSDPYVGLFAAIERLRKGERIIIQILFKGVRNPWAESIIRAASDNEGGSFFVNAPELLKQAKEKVTAPLFAVCVRVISFASSIEEAANITKQATNSLLRSSASQYNSLALLSNDGHSTESYFEDAYMRRTHRIGMILNSRELTTLAHIPSSASISNKLVIENRKTKALPEKAIGHQMVLGINYHEGIATEVSLPASVRLKHTHLIGATGTGKSTLLLSMIVQDMRHGNGVAVLDPHGDLIETILAHVPDERMEDVLLVDPADAEFPVGFNILSAHSDVERDILSSDLVAAFRRLSASWGDQMNSVFANAILAFLEHTEGGTLIDLRRFLVEKSFREAHLKGVTDPNIAYYWQHEYPLLKGSSIGSILTRLDTFLRPKLIRNMVAQKKGIDFEDILKNKKILLIKLSQGLMGAENSYLLGTFFVSKIYQAAFARQAQSQAQRSDYHFYIDEFQHFTTPSMSHILSGARKYALGLVLAHQDMQQLQKHDSELASSVVVNAATRICFRLGDNDAKRFASGLSYFDAQDLENLNTGEAIVRIEQPSFDFNLTTLPLKEPPDVIMASKPQLIISLSRAKYGTPRLDVEAAMAQLANLTVRTEPVIEETKARPEPNVQELTSTIPIIEEVMPNAAIPIKPDRIKKTETQHRYLQTLVKRIAESRGYKAVIEAQTKDGKGRVDVSLERESEQIACEITVTTTEAWETHNVEKCLSDGYDSVIVCSNDSKHLERIKTRLITALSPEIQSKVHAFLIEDVIRYFDQRIAEENKVERVIKGYKVSVEYATSSEEETNRKSNNILTAVTNSIRKRKVR